MDSLIGKVIVRSRSNFLRSLTLTGLNFLWIRINFKNWNKLLSFHVKAYILYIRLASFGKLLNLWRCSVTEVEGTTLVVEGSEEVAIPWVPTTNLSKVNNLFIPYNLFNFTSIYKTYWRKIVYSTLNVWNHWCEALIKNE